MYAIIVTFNRLNYLKTTIQKSLDFGFDEIVVVDNASSDGTREFLSSINSDKLKVITLIENTGGAGGFYEGLKYARENYKSGWVCLFDDDSYPDVSKDFVLSEISKVQSTRIGCIAASVFLPDGGISEMNRVGTNPFKSTQSLVKAIKNGRAGFHVSNKDYHGESKEIDTASFVGCFVNLESLRKSNILPRKEFFIYGDDVLFTYEFTQAGYQNFFVPSVKFIHDCYSYDQNSVYTSLWKVYYLYRNGLEVYKTISKVFFPLVFVRYIAIWLKRTQHYGENKKRYLKIFKLAVKDWVTGNYSRKLPEIIEYTK